MTVEWKMDHDAHSWHTTDRDGCFYRVTKVVSCINHQIEWHWATAWSESTGLRIGTHLRKTLEDAKAAMEHIMPTEEEVAA